MSLVLDASVALRWLLEHRGGTALQPIIDRIVQDGAVVPNLWHLEVANGLLRAVSSGTVPPEFPRDALEDLLQLEIEVDVDTHVEAWKSTLRLAGLYRLTAYDAAYLELAQRRRLPLATLDRALVAAGQAAGVEILP